MGRNRSDKWAHLPRRMVARQRRSGERTRYYYVTNGTPRTEVPLGQDYRQALARYCSIEQIDEIEIPPANAAKALHRLVVKNGRAKGVLVSLTEDDIADMLAASQGRCEITGIPFSYRKDQEGKRFRAWVPSVDRILPGGPYTRENTRLVCAAVNIAMNQLGDAVFLRIAAHATVRQKLLRSTADSLRSGADGQNRKTPEESGA